MAVGDEITGLATREAATSTDDGPVAQLQDIAGRALQGLTVLTGLLDNLAERVGRLENVQQRTRSETDQGLQSSQALLDDLSARVCSLERSQRSPDALDAAARLIRTELSWLTRAVRWPKA